MANRTWGTPHKLSDAQVDRYLTHIGLEVAATRARPADRALLAEVQLAHMIRVPFDTSALHLPADVPAGDATPFAHMRGPGIRADVPGAFAQVVERARGGYCFALNTVFAALLRALGFTVSEIAGRVYQLRNQDPAEVGWAWTSIMHVSPTHCVERAGASYSRDARCA
jgi:N-hydroxyarylamine O-acetyltransferase